MTTSRPTTNSTPSDTLPCPRCNSSLPAHALFCSFCGERIKEESTKGPVKQSNDTAQEQEEVTVRLTPLSGKDLKRWQVSRTIQNRAQPRQPRKTNPLPQEIETPMPATLLPSLPTTPVPSMPYQSDWLWPMSIILTTIATDLVNFVFPTVAIRPIIVFLFLFVCPGMAFVRLLRLREPVVEWTLAVALSFAGDAIVAALFLYTGRWSPTAILSILLGLSLIGATIQLTTIRSTLLLALRLQAARVRKRHVPYPLILTLLVLVFIVLLVGAGLWMHIPMQSAHVVTPKASSTSKTTPAPTVTISVTTGTSYQGTIFNVASNVTTKMSLTGIVQGNIKGHFTGLQVDGSFEGNIDASKHIRFTVKDRTGRAVLTFDGMLRSDGYLVGSYCSVGTQGQCNGTYGYGVWSAAPASSH